MSASLVTAWPLSPEAVRRSWLQSCCAVAEGADVLLPQAVPDAPSRCPPDVCVAAALGDALRRVSVLGGREGMSRSLASVYAGSVTRFLGGSSFRGVVSRVIKTPGVRSSCNGIAVSRDGRTLLVCDCDGRSHPGAIHEIDVADGSRRRVVGSKGHGPLQFYYPRELWIGRDFVFVVSVFSRGDGALLRRFGSSGDGQLSSPYGLCFMSDDRHIAVADGSVDGEFIRRVGWGRTVVNLKNKHQTQWSSAKVAGKPPPALSVSDAPLDARSARHPRSMFSRLVDALAPSGIADSLFPE
jgi:hypothetical protein